MMRIAACAFTIASLSSAAAMAQPPEIVRSAQLPSRDAAPAETGTAVIRGRVVAGDSGQPLRRAQVRISGSGLREGRVTTTDPQGRFELKDLPAGRFNLSASKAGYVLLSYGQTRANEAGRPLQVTEGQVVERVDFALPRGSVISGRVVDEFGEPVADAMVMPMRITWQQGQRRPVGAGRSSMTNDIGEFRLFGLNPGEYYVSATLRGNMSFNDVSDERAGYAPTYYPGTPNLGAAQPIAVGVGETRSEVVVSLVPARTARVSGRVIGSDGRPATGGNVMMMQRTGTMSMATGNGMIRPDGSFTLSNVAPGEYIIRAMITAPSTGGGVIEFTEPAFPSTAVVSVNGEDVTGVLVAPPSQVTLSGSVLLPPTATGTVRPDQINVSATPAVFEPFFTGGRPATLREDFTFALKVAPGSLVIRANIMAPNATWAVRRVRVGGIDVTDTPVDFAAGRDVSGIEIELTNTPPEVSGTVTDDRGGVVTNYTALLFSRDPERWFTGRHVALGRPDQAGRFTVRTLRPGDYYAVALDAVDSSQLGNPEFLEAQIANATRFSVGDGETRVLTLKMMQPR